VRSRETVSLFSSQIIKLINKNNLEIFFPEFYKEKFFLLFKPIHTHKHKSNQNEGIQEGRPLDDHIRIVYKHKITQIKTHLS